MDSESSTHLLRVQEKVTGPKGCHVPLLHVQNLVNAMHPPNHSLGGPTLWY